MAKKSKRYGYLKFTFTALSVILCILIGLFLKYSQPAPDDGKDFIKVLDVGQSECIFIYSNGYSALIDTGLSTYSGDVSYELGRWKIKKLDVLMISHLHNDHTGGIPDLLGIYDVENLILPELSIESEGMAEAQFAINAVTKSGGNVYNAVQGMNFSIGEFEVTILASYGNMDDENNRSVIAVAEIDGVRFLFTGDAEEKVEKRLLEEGLDLKCEVLKVGHHGSHSSSGDEFLKAVDPRYAVISCGEGNMYGHPHNEVLSALENLNSKIYRTDTKGNITFYIVDGEITVKCGE